MTLHDAKRIHIVGIGGIGISALGKWALEQGKVVSGSDVKENQLTLWLQHHGAVISIGPHTANNVPEDCDLLLYSVATEPGNPERRSAERRSIDFLSYPQALDQLLQGKVGIAVAGTHGKSTTTAMLAHVLIHAKRDPSVIVGTRVRLFGDTNERLGKGQEFILEADEYNQGILLYHPTHAIVLNVDREHVDIYPTLQDSQHAFQTFASHILPSGSLTLNADDPSLELLRSASAAPVQTFGFTKADLVGSNIHVTPTGTTFTVAGLYTGTVQLQVYGAHNVQDALAVLCVAHRLGIPFEIARDALAEFPGTWRRFERRGTWRGATIIDDYGHHPTELAATIDAARQVFPGQRLVVVFQPHTHSRTIAFAEQFAIVLRRADAVVMTDVYDVPGRERGPEADVPAIVQSIGQLATYVHTVPDAVAKIASIVQPNDVILTIGAGDITTFYDLAQKENPKP